MGDTHRYEFFELSPLPEGGLLVRFRHRGYVGPEIGEALQQELDSLVDRERLLLVDLSNVDVLDENALHALLHTHRSLVRLGGAMSVCGLRGPIAEVFRITRLDRLFNVYPDLETALQGRNV